MEYHKITNSKPKSKTHPWKNMPVSPKASQIDVSEDEWDTYMNDEQVNYEPYVNRDRKRPIDEVDYYEPLIMGWVSF